MGVAEVSAGGIGMCEGGPGDVVSVLGRRELVVVSLDKHSGWMNHYPQC